MDTKRTIDETLPDTSCISLEHCTVSTSNVANATNCLAFPKENLDDRDPVQFMKEPIEQSFNQCSRHQDIPNIHPDWIVNEIDYGLITERRKGVFFPKGLLRPTQREHS